MPYWHSFEPAKYRSIATFLQKHPELGDDINAISAMTGEQHEGHNAVHIAIEDYNVYRCLAMFDGKRRKSRGRVLVSVCPMFVLPQDFPNLKLALFL